MIAPSCDDRARAVAVQAAIVMTQAIPRLAGGVLRGARAADAYRTSSASDQGTKRSMMRAHSVAATRYGRVTRHEALTREKVLDAAMALVDKGGRSQQRRSGP
jgi:hypothetical protein